MDQNGILKVIGAKELGKLGGSILGRFLGSFASQGPTEMKMMHKGVNDLLLIATEYELTSALGNTETLTLALPAAGVGLDLGVGGASGQGKVNYVPIFAMAFTNADPQLPVWMWTANTFVMTNFDRDTNRVIFTGGSTGIPDNSVLVVLWVQSTLGT